ncbi:DUF1217 domain-containing protein [Pseudophaeobacter sp. C1-32P7]|uniref:DUF1217 domain-containing protein n=1 Tax=Pseudophaeobacter sp. C1-32P7 TaxID=3098142 RepID=UPI0034D74437
MILYQPIIPADGIVGWRILQATYDKQFETFSNDTLLKSESDYFRENIGNIKTAGDLVKDTRLLGIALGAFGLDDQLPMKALVQKVLEEGSSADDALANRLGDDRWVAFTEAFGFGPGDTVKTGSVEDMENIIFSNKTQSFEAAVGVQNESMRIALFAERELVNIATDLNEDGEPTSIDTKWYNIIGQPALQKMFQTTFNLPPSFIQLDVDRQLEIYKDRAQNFLGTDDLSVYADPEKMEELTTRYLAQAQLADYQSSQSSASTALRLLLGS